MMRRFYIFLIFCFILQIFTAPVKCSNRQRSAPIEIGLQTSDSEASAGIAQDTNSKIFPDKQQELQRTQVTKADDELIWEEFAKWVRSLKRRNPGQSGSLRDLYIEHLVKSGVTMDEAKRCLGRIDVLRGQTLDRERIYWDGKHKLGDSPSEPLDHVRDAVRGMRPGKALDVAMGSGRHAIFLAKLGWDATGYDFSFESVRGALALAANAGVKITAVQATHDTFDFGVSRWNLIIVTYPYYDTMNPAWPPRLWRATKPGGHVVFQGVANEGSTLADFAELWRPFQLIQCEITETGEDWFEGRESRTVKIIALKKQTEN